MKRKVQIDDISISGISLRVIFNVLPTGWPSLSVPCPSMSAANGKLSVCSPPFKLVSEAEKWLEELTEEVKKLITLDQELTGKFKQLEGENVINED